MVAILPEALKKIASRIASKVSSDEFIEGVEKVGRRIIDNYSKRRDVGFDVKDSVSGSVKETSSYYYKTVTGEEPVVMIPGIYFE